MSSTQSVTISIRSDATGAVSTFRAVADGARTMGDSLDTAGQKGARSFDGLMKAAQVAGAALGATVVLANRLAGESEAAAARLDTAFANAGLAVQDYRSQIEAVQSTGLKLGFDDEDVSDSIAKLIAVTKDYGEAVSGVQLAENIARQERISLAAATDIVEAAEAGRFRGLAQLGIVLGDTATKQDYLAAANAKYAGSAQAYAET